MEKVTTTFKSDDREIIVNFELNNETGDLNYNVTVEPPFKDENDLNNGGLCTFLANTFLGALTVPSEFTEDAENTNIESDSRE